MDKVRNYLTNENGWDFSDPQRTKELNLTHNLIAGKAGFPNLMELHNSDGILGYRDKLKKNMEPTGVDGTDKTFGEVIDAMREHYRGASEREKKKAEPTPGQELFISNHAEDYEFAKGLPFSDFNWWMIRNRVRTKRVKRVLNALRLLSI